MKKTKGLYRDASTTWKICAVVAHIGFFGALLLKVTLDTYYGFIFFLFTYCFAHAYYILSQSYFNARRGSNIRRNFILGGWAPFTNIPPLLFMIYLLMGAIGNTTIISLGEINDILVRTLAIVWFLTYFFISPSIVYAGAGLYPFSYEYRNDVFNRFETVLYLVNLAVMISLIYVFVVAGKGLQEQAKVVSDNTEKIITNGILESLITFIAILVFWIYVMKLKKYQFKKK